MLKNYLKFINENIKPKLKYYAFDVDDNLLFIPTKIYMQEKVGEKWIEKEVSTEKFAKIREDKVNWKYSEKTFPFYNFRDYNPDIFYEDAIEAIKNNKFGPSWKTFLKCLINGALFAIITARGHEPKTIRKVVEYIIYNVLKKEQRNEMASNLMAYAVLFDDADIFVQHSFEKLVKHYLNICDFIGVSSQSFMKKHPEFYSEFGASNPEAAKVRALEDFMKKLIEFGKQIGAKVKLGFSDDDIRTTDNIEQHFNEKKLKLNFSIFDTSNPEKIIKTEI